MEKIDVVIAVLAVAAVVGSAAGLVTYTPSAKTFIVSFSTEDLDDVAQNEGQRTGTGSDTLELDVTHRNVTEVRVEVTVETQNSMINDRDVEVEVGGPGEWSDTGSGTLSTDAGESGDTVETSFSFAISEVPEGFERRSRDIGEVRSEANESASHAMGAGTWSVNITISGQDPPVGSNCQTEDCQFSYDAELSLTRFKSRVDVKQEDLTLR